MRFAPSPSSGKILSLCLCGLLIPKCKMIQIFFINFIDLFGLGISWRSWRRSRRAMAKCLPSTRLFSFHLSFQFILVFVTQFALAPVANILSFSHLIVWNHFHFLFSVAVKLKLGHYMFERWYEMEFMTVQISVFRSAVCSFRILPRLCTFYLDWFVHMFNINHKESGSLCISILDFSFWVVVIFCSHFLFFWSVLLWSLLYCILAFDMERM